MSETQTSKIQLLQQLSISLYLCFRGATLRRQWPRRRRPQFVPSPMRLNTYTINEVTEERNN